jgi:signal transduction histidine kinase
MSELLRLLLIEDQESDAVLLDRALRRGGFTPSCLRVETAEEMKEALRAATWDLIIADYKLPHFDGPSALRIYKETAMDIPFIIVSGTIGEDLAVEAMKLGAHDYVMKSNLTRLVPAVERELRDAAARAAHRQVEQQLRRTERLRLVGELTSSLIHDLKNPLQSILSSAELLNVDNVKPERREKLCSMIERHVRQVSNMSDEVLDFVRGDIRLNVHPVDLVKLIQDVAETYSLPFAKSGVELICSTGCDGCLIPEVICDEQRIWRVLQNLLANARDAMPEGGRITLGVSAMGDHALIEVTDTGGGIPESIQCKLFEPFVSHGKKHGTGLGLAIVKNIIDAHGGTIAFRSETGTGTTFSVELPRTPHSHQRATVEATCELVDE